MVEAIKDEHRGSFNRYDVGFKVEKLPTFGEIKIKDFTDTASVYIKIEGQI
jgi:hypothetical protein